METFLLVLHIILSFTIVVVILMQSGKGGGLGAGFNNAAAMGQEVFGGRGAASFLGKLTVVLGTSFMITSMALAWYSSKPQSALDLDMEAEEPAQAQVHDIIEEGEGEGLADDELLEDDASHQPQMPVTDPGEGADPGDIDIGDLMGGDEADDSDIEIEIDDEEGPSEDIQEQLEEQMELEVETDGDDEAAPEIELQQEMPAEPAEPVDDE